MRNKRITSTNQAKKILRVAGAKGKPCNQDYLPLPSLRRHYAARFGYDEKRGIRRYVDDPDSQLEEIQPKTG